MLNLKSISIAGKKKKLANFLFFCRAFDFAPLLGNRALVIFNYHRIRPDDPSFVNEFDDGVFGPTIEMFERQIRWISKRFTILDENAIIEVAKNGKLEGGPSAAITFDDGYADNYNLAYPVLRRYGVPAIFFIPTDPITSRQLGWWDIIAFLIKKTAKTTIQLGTKTFRPTTNQRKTICAIQGQMSREPADQTSNLIANLSDACEVQIPSIERQGKELMTWAQVKTLSQNGQAIGSHTHSHRVLSTLPVSDQCSELKKAKRIIQDHIGAAVRTIAYPVGGYSHFSLDTQRQAQQCGYDAAFSYNTGINRWGIKNRFDIKRISATNDLELFAGSAVLPEVFAWQ